MFGLLLTFAVFFLVALLFAERVYWAVCWRRTEAKMSRLRADVQSLFVRLQKSEIREELRGEYFELSGSQKHENPVDSRGAVGTV